MIDTTNSGLINVTNLEEFLISQSHIRAVVPKKKLQAIIRRIDTDGDSCIDFKDFHVFMKN